MKLVVIMLLLVSASWNNLITVGFAGDLGNYSSGDDVEVFFPDATTTSSNESEILLYRAITYSNKQESNSSTLCMGVTMLCLSASLMAAGICFTVGPCGQ